MTPDLNQLINTLRLRPMTEPAPRNENVIAYVDDIETGEILPFVVYHTGTKWRHVYDEAEYSYPVASLVVWHQVPAHVTAGGAA